MANGIAISIVGTIRNAIHGLVISPRAPWGPWDGGAEGDVSAPGSSIS